MGKEKLHQIPPSPVTVVKNFRGYHAAEVRVAVHNLFEEVPSLGITGDMVIALASPCAEPQPNIQVRRPENSKFTDNLLGKFSQIGPR